MAAYSRATVREFLVNFSAANAVLVRVQTNDPQLTGWNQWVFWSGDSIPTAPP
jgi:hypothetical protein